MKIIHTSDWHLGHALYHYDRTAEQQDFLRQLTQIVAEEQPDALLVSGDVYHTSTPAAAVQGMLVEALVKMHDACPHMHIVVTAGNHDSAARLEADALLWKLAGVTIVGGVRRTPNGDPDYERHIVAIPDKGWVVAIPHVYSPNCPTPPDAEVPRDKRFTHFCQAALDLVEERNEQGLPVVLMAHLAVSGSDFAGHDTLGMMETVDIQSLGTGYDYAALGHIHRPQTLDIDGRVRYSGTPLPVSFDEQCEHSVSVVTLHAHNKPTIATRRITNKHPLHTLPPKEPADIEDALQMLADYRHDRPTYIRLNVKVEDFIPSDARTKAAAIAAENNHRFCTFKITTSRPDEQPVNEAISVEELQELSVVEVANMYYNQKLGRDLSQQETSMLMLAIQETENPSEP